MSVIAKKGNYQARESTFDRTSFGERVIDRTIEPEWSSFVDFFIPEAYIGETLILTINFKHHPMGQNPRIVLQVSTPAPTPEDSTKRTILSLKDALSILPGLCGDLAGSWNQCEAYCRKYYETYEKPLWVLHFATHSKKPAIASTANARPIQMASTLLHQQSAGSKHEDNDADYPPRFRVAYQ